MVSESLRLLVAEDDEFLREILQEGLEAEGFDVVSAADGAQALELFLTSGPYDALLLDDEMPRLTGRKVLARLREAGERVAALLFSGSLVLDENERAGLGVGAVLRKPVSITELTAAIRRTLASASVDV